MFLIRFWRNVLFVATAYGAGMALVAVTGAAEGPVLAPCVIFGWLASVACERDVREMIFRAVARRPHPDYGRIAELERELGMTPSGPLMPVKAAPARHVATLGACDCGCLSGYASFRSERSCRECDTQERWTA